MEDKSPMTSPAYPIAVNASALPRPARARLARLRRLGRRAPTYYRAGQFHQIPLPYGSSAYGAAAESLLQSGWRLVLGG